MEAETTHLEDLLKDIPKFEPLIENYEYSSRALWEDVSTYELYIDENLTEIRANDDNRLVGFETTRVYIDYENPYKLLNFKPKWGDVSILDGKLYYRYDYDSCDSKIYECEYLDAQEMLRSMGWVIDDPQMEHDCLTGFLVPYKI